jgi:hypothetical protein
MNTRVKSWVVGLVVLALGLLGMVKVAEAASTDTIVLRVTPVVNLSVTISSPTDGIGYDFGGVDLGATSQAGLPATVTNNGNVNAQWMLRSETETGYTWTPGNAVATDVAVLQALFGQPNGAYPIPGNFDITDSTMSNLVNRSSQNDLRYSTGGIMGASIPPSGPNNRRLWFRIKMPPESTIAVEQRFRMFVVAGNP